MERTIFGIGLREFIILFLLIFTGLLPLGILYFLWAENPVKEAPVKENDPLELKIPIEKEPVFASGNFKAKIGFM